MTETTDLELLKVQIKAELQRLEAGSPAKEIAGKAIGKDGLKYITAIVVIGVLSSLALDSEKIAAVMGLLGASLTALISMRSLPCRISAKLLGFVADSCCSANHGPPMIWSA